MTSNADESRVNPPAAWGFEYDQCPLSGIWIYKFDHAPIHDTGWHKVLAKSSAYYRIVGGYLQYVRPNEQVSEDDRQWILDSLTASGPLKTDDELEIVIRRKGDRFDMWSHWVYQDAGVAFAGLTETELNDAYGRLGDLEDQFGDG